MILRGHRRVLATVALATIAGLCGRPMESVADEVYEPQRLALRIQRLESIKEIERLQDAFGYYQDRFLFGQSAALFSRDGAAVYEDGRAWSGARSLDRWIRDLRRRYGLRGDGPVAGVMADRPQIQGIIDVEPDGSRAHAHFRTLERDAVYASSEGWQGGVYDNDYVREEGRWKLQVLRYCTMWRADYQSGRLHATAGCADPKASVAHPDRPAGVEEAKPSLGQLTDRVQRLSDLDQIERLQYIYGYQQDKLLWSEQVDLFADDNAVAIFQNAEYLGKAGVRRLWYGHWSRMTHDSLMPVDGVLNDHFQAQPVITLAADGQTALARFRARDYVFNYALPLAGGRDSAGADIHDEFSTGSQVRSAGALALLQDVIYEDAFVKEHGIWKIKTFNLCIYASAPYDRGYTDRPITGVMGAAAGAKPGERRRLDMEEGLPERSQDLFPANPIGPDRVLSPEDTGCYGAKNQVMSRSMVFPFHYPNPVSGERVQWSNR